MTQNIYTVLSTVLFTLLLGYKFLYQYEIKIGENEIELKLTYMNSELIANFLNEDVNSYNIML